MTIWLIFSPDDTESASLFEDAGASTRYDIKAGEVPSKQKRFAENPVATALTFEKMMTDVPEHVIGYDVKLKKPYEHEGKFGRPLACMYAIEEQARLALHRHLLV